MNKDYYKTLNIKRNSSQDEIKKVTLDDVFHSVVKKLKYSKNINCGVCKGAKGTTQRCPTCKGAGFVQVAMGNAFFRQIQKQQCTTCMGQGNLVITQCSGCVGKGSESLESTVDFKIPEDLMTGQHYTFKGLGER